MPVNHIGEPQPTLDSRPKGVRSQTCFASWSHYVVAEEQLQSSLPIMDLMNKLRSVV